MGIIKQTTVTHLEMLSEPRLRGAPTPKGAFVLQRSEKPTLHFYRYLYNTVGHNHDWVCLLYTSDAADE